MKTNILIMMILMLFVNPLHSEEISKTIPKIPQTQEVEKSVSQERVDAIEEGILKSIGMFIGTHIIMPILSGIWIIIVGMFSFLWTLISPFLLPIVGVIALLLLFAMGSA